MLSIRLESLVEKITFEAFPDYTYFNKQKREKKCTNASMIFGAVKFFFYSMGWSLDDE